MRETKFIEQNKEKWSKFERVLESKKKDPDELSDLFIEVTDDLSYARTFYPSRSVTVFLNGLAQKIFQKLNGVKYVKKNRFIQFWVEELPHSVYLARKELLLSLFVFLLAALIGAVSTAYDDQFPRQILGDSYVNMTLNNIEKGDPMAVYKDKDDMDMFLGITINNVRVAFFTFLLGVFFSVGSIGFILYNGIMLGTFQYFFYQHGLLGTSALTIWQHGTLEIASIVIAGGAGITLGKGLVFPGTYSRGQSFFLSAQSGVRVLLGIVPILVIAALIESFYTRFTGAPFAIRLGVIIVSFLFILWYFVWYPYRKWKTKGFDKSYEEEKIFSLPKQVINFAEVKTIGQILADTFTLYVRYSKKIFKFSIALAMISVVLIYFFGGDYYAEAQHFDWPFDLFFGFTYFFDYDNYGILFLINSVAFALNAFVVFYIIKSEEENNSPKALWKHLFTKAVLRYISILLLQLVLGLFLFGDGLAITLFLFLSPIFSLAQFIAYRNGFNAVPAKLFFYLKQDFGKMLLVYICFFLLSYILNLLVSSPLVGLYMSFFTWNFNLDSALLTVIVNGLWLLIEFFFLYLIMALFALSSGILFYNMQEVGEAGDLKKKIENIGAQ